MLDLLARLAEELGAVILPVGGAALILREDGRRHLPPGLREEAIVIAPTGAAVTEAHRPCPDRPATGHGHAQEPQRGHRPGRQARPQARRPERAGERGARRDGEEAAVRDRFGALAVPARDARGRHDRGARGARREGGPYAVPGDVDRGRRAGAEGRHRRAETVVVQAAEFAGAREDRPQAGDPLHAQRGQRRAALRAAAEEPDRGVIAQAGRARALRGPEEDLRTDRAGARARSLVHPGAEQEFLVAEG
ncbi:hypothetical protein STANM309S_00938 [Streptomyces tanashiensis]